MRISLLGHASLLVLCGSVLVAVQDASAQTPPDSTDPPETIELTVAAAAEPQPALKYRLTPTPSERTPGNAAQYYYRAMLQLRRLSSDHWDKYDEHEAAWLAKDRQSYPKGEVAKWLAPTESTFVHLKTAAYREYCDWDLRVQDLRGMQTINFLLDDAQFTRKIARVIQLKAHYEIMDGRLGDAFETLRLGYQLAHDVGRTPLIINGLIGIAIGGVMNQELTVLIDHSPTNFYWALAGLPRPLVELRPALEYELNMPFQLYPFLKDAETTERTPEEWRRLIVDCIGGLNGLEGSGQALPSWQAELAATAAMTRLYPVAKERLLASGLDREKLEAMPVGQVVAIHTARATTHAYHEVFKTALLPYNDAMQRLPIVMQQLQKNIVRPGTIFTGEAGLPIAGILLPAVHNVLQVEVRTQRSVAALQAIEALRMHAAASGGKFPQKLADVTIVPVPADAASGQPFGYQLDAASGTATLDAPPIAGWPARGVAKRYVIQLEK
jgi:hypothetical protein